MRCPCRKCLLAPICKDPCPDFLKFIKPVNKGCDVLEKVFETIDGFLTEGSTASRIYDWFSEHIIRPVIFYPAVFILGIKTDINESTLFDKRFNVWEQRNNK